jgi:lipoic acid synthetase
MSENQERSDGISIRKPRWLSSKLPVGKEYIRLREIVKNQGLHTICTSGNCPNMGECWSRGTATLMILGDICTRSCLFCGVSTGKPLEADCNEPEKIAQSIKELGLQHCVLTSVTRDDLADGGAAIWAETIHAIKKNCPGTTLETLIPDFRGNLVLVQKIIDSKPEVISHNLETVRQLTPLIRSGADYKRSLSVIKHISDSGTISKSGIMLGLGETKEEVLETMKDLRSVDCAVLTIGQYLQPTPKHHPVQEFIHPDVFGYYREEGLKQGFTHVESSPLVRSSYHAEKHIIKG